MVFNGGGISVNFPLGGTAPWCFRPCSPDAWWILEMPTDTKASPTTACCSPVSNRLWLEVVEFGTSGLCKEPIFLAASGWEDHLQGGIHACSTRRRYLPLCVKHDCIINWWKAWKLGSDGSQCGRIWTIFGDLLAKSCRAGRCRPPCERFTGGCYAEQ